MAEEPITTARPSDQEVGVGTPGMTRFEAIAREGLWSGIVRTAPGSWSGWHHHGDHESVLYVLSGAMTLQFGSGGGDSVVVGEGEFGHVPRGTVHREGNEGSTDGEAVVFRSGSGEVVFNVEGPE